MGCARGLGDSAAAAAGAFLSGQKGTKEPSKERGISISPSPLKTSPLKTTNQGGLRSPLLDVPPWGRCAGVVAPHGKGVYCNIQAQNKQTEPPAPEFEESGSE